MRMNKRNKKFVIFSSDEVKNKPQRWQLARLGTAAYILAMAIKAPNKDVSWALMNYASKMFHPLESDAFNTLYGSAALSIAHNQDCDEYHYQRLFKKYAHVFMKGAKVIHVPSDRKNVPDAWLSVGEEHIPVEVKLHDFDQKALAQLTRYMNAYHCKRGVAVARTLSVVLPDNVVFILNDALDELDRIEKGDA